MVDLSQNAVIAQGKLTQYLLVPLPKDDKSKFLAQAGYTIDNWRDLEDDLRTQVLSKPAVSIETTRYGEKYSIRTRLQGRDGKSIDILTIWQLFNGAAKFVTLLPDKGGHSS